MKNTVLITGASNGIGKGLTYEYAKRGYDIALLARNENSLQNIVYDLRERFPTIKAKYYILDVTKTETVLTTLEKAFEEFGKMDIVIANAGIAGGGKAGSGKLSEDIAIFETNVIGAVATIDSAVNLLKRQGEGQIVAISSVAAFRGLPGAGAYCASKAALSTYMQSLQAELQPTPISSTILYPGYIDTDLNKNMKSRPFLITVDEASPIIANLIARKVKRSTVPVYPWKFIGTLLRVLPDNLFSAKK
ncbi:MAG: SDR family NAD(P)-dependent oxidoreductase [Pseudomonadales bacterium]|nr:SDR family NAD(P)-dependent oxidoreductase [Pseudomonadales bacterium]